MKKGSFEDTFLGEKHWRSGYNDKTLIEKLEPLGFRIAKICYSYTHHLLPHTPFYFPLNMLMYKLLPFDRRTCSRINVIAQKCK